MFDEFSALNFYSRFFRFLEFFKVRIKDLKMVYSYEMTVALTTPSHYRKMGSVTRAFNSVPYATCLCDYSLLFLSMLI